ncbi:MAG TPA: DUF4153 domain-containing protein [Acidiferrobacterales bacterium]
MGDLSRLTRNAIIGLGLGQGVLLLLAHVLIERNVLAAPADMTWLLPWYAVAIAVPTALQLIATDVRDRRLWRAGLGLAAVLVFTGAHVGYAVEPAATISSSPVVVPYVLTTFIGWFVLLPFVQTWLKTGRLRPPYPELFEFAWNNTITLIIAEVFTGIFWALLALWAALFKVIGVTLFDALFYDKYFSYPVTATVFAFALYLGRSNLSAVVTVRRIILAIFKGLLPLLAVLIVLFLAVLPFMGLKPLWDTGSATALMLTLQIFLVIFLNAVYQDGRGEAPYPVWLRLAVRVAVIVLPVYTLLCLYALHLRIGQHGWSTDRFWAVLLAVVVGLYAFGYAVAALRRSTVWMAGMAPVNVAIAAVTVALAVLVNSPLLDARRISVASQIDRLLAGKLTAEKFDYDYLRFELGRAGNAALEGLKALTDHPQAAEIRTAATRVLSRTNRWTAQADRIETTEQAAAHFAVYPKGERLDGEFLRHAMCEPCDWRLKRCLEVGRHCAALVVDLNRDARKEYVLFHVNAPYDRFAAVFSRAGKEWEYAGELSQPLPAEWDSLAHIEEMLATGDYAVVDSAWRDLRIGAHIRPFRPE